MQASHKVEQIKSGKPQEAQVYSKSRSAKQNKHSRKSNKRDL